MTFLTVVIYEPSFKVGGKREHFFCAEHATVEEVGGKGDK